MSVNTEKKFRVYNSHRGMDNTKYDTLEAAQDGAKRFHEYAAKNYGHCTGECDTIIMKLEGYVKSPVPNYEIVKV